MKSSSYSNFFEEKKKALYAPTMFEPTIWQHPTVLHDFHVIVFFTHAMLDNKVSATSCSALMHTRRKLHQPQCTSADRVI